MAVQTAWHAQVVIGMDSGLPEDACVNNWTFVTDNPLLDESDALDAVVARLNQFYGSVDGLLANSVNPNDVRCKVYDRSDPVPRVPKRNVLLTGLVTGTGGPGPSEVAICLSFHGTVESGDVAARKRGRVFIGPLQQDNLGARPSSSMRESLAAAAGIMIDASDLASAAWAVWSEVDQAASLVTGGWIDDAWDTQRRRGVAPTVRTLFT